MRTEVGAGPPRVTRRVSLLLVVVALLASLGFGGGSAVGESKKAPIVEVTVKDGAPAPRGVQIGPQVAAECYVTRRVICKDHVHF